MVTGGGGKGEEIHRNWMTTVIISISVITVQTFLWNVQRRGVSSNSDPLGQTEKGERGEGAKIEHFSWVS